MGSADNPSDMPHEGPRRRPYYGWVVVAAAFTGMFFAFGISYSFGAFLPSIEQAFGAARTDASLVSAIGASLLFILGAASGPLADRLGPAVVASAGMVLMGLGLLAAGETTAIWQLYLVYGFGIGLGAGLVYLPVIGAVQRWFVRRRGLASGLAVTGMGAGVMTMAPLSVRLIDELGWRDAYTALALLVLTIGAAAMLLLRHAPPGDAPHPDGAAEATGPLSPALEMTLGAAAATRALWMCFAASLLFSYALFVPVVHIVPYAIDHGLGERTGAWLLSTIGIASIAGRFLFGAIADRFGRLRTLAAVYLAAAAVLVFWYFARELWSLGLFVLVFGLLYGGFAPLMPVIASDRFGIAHIGAILGLIISGAGIGVFFGSTTAGLLYDLTGDYRLAIFTAAGAMLVGGLCLASIDVGQARRFRPASSD